jgi:hypothetical protein
MMTRVRRHYAGRHPHEQRRHGLDHDEDPLVVAERKRAEHGFHPRSTSSTARRIVDPIFHGLNVASTWGLFLKDYKPVPW